MFDPLMIRPPLVMCFPAFRCMVAGAALADLREGGSAKGDDTIEGRAPTSLVLGLGGGALPMALRRMYPGMKILAVEIDPDVTEVAKEHFGLNESDSLKVRCGSSVDILAVPPAGFSNVACLNCQRAAFNFVFGSLHHIRQLDAAGGNMSYRNLFSVSRPELHYSPLSLLLL